MGVWITICGKKERKEARKKKMKRKAHELVIPRVRLLCLMQVAAIKEKKEEKWHLLNRLSRFTTRLTGLAGALTVDISLSSHFQLGSMFDVNPDTWHTVAWFVSIIPTFF